jgi:hypothetical protein
MSIVLPSADLFADAADLAFCTRCYLPDTLKLFVLASVAGWYICGQTRVFEVGRLRRGVDQNILEVGHRVPKLVPGESGGGARETYGNVFVPQPVNKEIITICGSRRRSSRKNTLFGRDESTQRSDAIRDLLVGCTRAVCELLQELGGSGNGGPLLA